MSVTIGDSWQFVNPQQKWPTYLVTYSFIEDGNPPDYYTNDLLQKPDWGFGTVTKRADTLAMTVSQQEALLAAMSSWASVANISFALDTSGSEEISLGRVPFTAGSKLLSYNAVAMGFLPRQFSSEGVQRNGDLWFDSKRPSNDERFFTEEGSSGYWLALHELGHTLGLAHPKSFIDSSWAINSWRYTVLSYKNLDGKSYDDKGATSAPTLVPELGRWEMEWQGDQVRYRDKSSLSEDGSRFRKVATSRKVAIR